MFARSLFNVGATVQVLEHSFLYFLVNLSVNYFVIMLKYRAMLCAEQILCTVLCTIKQR